MKFMLDESAEARLGVFLASQGHDSKRVGIDFPKSIHDEQVLEFARNEQRIILTNDKDFGELIFRQKLSHSGVIFFRFPLDSDAQQKLPYLQDLLVTHREDLERQEYLTVTPAGVRVRKTPRH